MSLAKAFMVVIERDWYVCCEPLEGRKARPAWEKAGGLMACCGMYEPARSDSDAGWSFETEFEVEVAVDVVTPESLRGAFMPL